MTTYRNERIVVLSGHLLQSQRTENRYSLTEKALKSLSFSGHSKKSMLNNFEVNEDMSLCLN